MLRALRSPNYRPKLLVTKFDTDSETRIVNPEVLSETIPASVSGETDMTLSKPFGRRCVPVVTPYGEDLSDGSVAGIESSTTATSASQFRVSSTTNTGAGEAGALHSFIAGWDSSDSIECSLQRVKTNLSSPRLIAMSVDGTGASSIIRGSGQATLTDSGTGSYTLRYTRAYGCSEPIVHVTTKGVYVRSATVTSSTSSECTVKTFDSDGNAADADFDIVILGNDATSMDSTIELQRPIQCPWLDPIMLAFTIDVSDGVPSLTVGSRFATITDLGVGNYSIDLKAAYEFAATPILAISCNSNNGRAQFNSDESDLVSNSLAGGAVADYGMNVLMFGSFRDATEY